MPIITADYIYTPEKWLENHVLEIAENGKILALRPLTAKDSPVIYKGVLSPGFVNAHCHLELSGLKGKIERHTGMSSFVGKIYSENTKTPVTEKENAIINAINLAFESGTQAFGDICNDTLSLIPKTEFPNLYFHNFVEVLGSNGSRAEQIWQNGEAILDTFQSAYISGNSSITLHAPYSVSENLVALCGKYYKKNPSLASVHLLESEEEIELFEKGTGGIAEFMKSIGIPFAGYPTPNPVEYLLEGVRNAESGIFIHLTEAGEKELAEIHRLLPQFFFCLCPRSNEYIHKKFPYIPDFLPYSDKICLGTDSLASNDDLNMLEEIKVTLRLYPEVSLHTLFTWLTVNGAKALRIPGAGAFIQGQNNGVIQIPFADIPDNILPEESYAVRLF